MEEQPSISITIKKINAVGKWAYNTTTDNCAICRNHLSDRCIECYASVCDETDACTVMWGNCNHTFHTHCVTKWIKTRPVCPLCNVVWEINKVESN